MCVQKQRKAGVRQRFKMQKKGGIKRKAEVWIFKIKKKHITSTRAVIYFVPGTY